MQDDNDFLNFCTASSSSYSKDEYSILNQIKEINPNIDIYSIDIEDKDNFFSTCKTSLIINIILTVFYSTYHHKITDINELKDNIISAIECGNLMFFKHITRIESARLRNGYTEIISKSFDHDEIDSESDDHDNMSSLFKFDDEMISQKVRDIIHFTSDCPEIKLRDFFMQFRETGVQSLRDIKSFSFMIDDEYSLFKKKMTILCGIFRNNESEIAKLKQLSLHIENYDRYYAEDLLLKLRSIPKSVWHFVNSMNISFLISMLLWIESSIGDNPHNIVVNSKPLLEYLKQCIIDNHPKEEYINDERTPHVIVPDDMTVLTRNRTNILESLESLIYIINKVKNIKDCRSCQLKVHFILNNKNFPKDSEYKTSHCEITDNLVKLKRKIHNLNKSTQKKFNAGESREASAVAPAFKQILSLIGTMANISFNSTKSTVHSSIAQIIDLKSFVSPFPSSSVIHGIPGGNDVSLMNRFTIMPLDLRDILNNDKYHSFIIFFDNNVHNKTNISIHKIYLEKEKKKVFLIVDLYMKNDNNPDAVGLYIICDTIDDLIEYFNTSSIYSNKKITSTIYLLKFKKEQQQEIMLYINSLMS